MLLGVMHVVFPLLKISQELLLKLDYTDKRGDLFLGLLFSESDFEKASRTGIINTNVSKLCKSIKRLKEIDIDLKNKNFLKIATFITVERFTQNEDHFKNVLSYSKDLHFDECFLNGCVSVLKEFKPRDANNITKESILKEKETFLIEKFNKR